MSAARELAQHPLPIRRISRFAQDLSIDFDNRIRTENPSPRMFSCNIPSFLVGHAESICLWQLSRLSGFGSITGDDDKSDTDPLQQLPTARGGRGKNELGSDVLLFHVGNL